MHLCSLLVRVRVRYFGYFRFLPLPSDLTGLATHKTTVLASLEWQIYSPEICFDENPLLIFAPLARSWATIEAELYISAYPLSIPKPQNPRVARRMHWTRGEVANMNACTYLSFYNRDGYLFPSILY